MTAFFDVTTSAKFTTKAACAKAKTAAAGGSTITIPKLGTIPYIADEAGLKKLLRTIHSQREVDERAFVLRHGLAWLCYIMSDGTVLIDPSETAAMDQDILRDYGPEIINRMTHESQRSIPAYNRSYVLTKSEKWGLFNTKNYGLPSNLKLKDLDTLDLLKVRFHDQPEDLRVCLVSVEAPGKSYGTVMCVGVTTQGGCNFPVEFESNQIMDRIGKIELY